MPGIARNDASCSIGWSVGRSSPIMIESWLRAQTTGRPIIAASRIAPQAQSVNTKKRAAHACQPDNTVPLAAAPVARPFGPAPKLGNALSQSAAIAMPTLVATPWPSGPVVVRRTAVLWMRGAPAAGLAEALQAHRHRLADAAEMEQAIEQRRGVADRRHEAVALGPCGVRRVEAQKALPEAASRCCRAHRRARAAGFRALDLVDGERAQGVDAQQIERGLAGGVHGRSPRSCR